MEELIKEQPSAGVSENSAARPKLQRYGLRSSSTRSKEQNLDASDVSNASGSKRGRASPSVTRSVVVLDFSGKDKSSSAKPPRRLSIPVKASATPSPKAIGNRTPISETRPRNSGNGQGPQSTIQTPRTSGRKKFSLLSSASYWLNQIKLSESEAKHSISLGFFKLALIYLVLCNLLINFGHDILVVFQPQPFQKVQDELKFYVHRNQLAELGEPLKELLQGYNIAENLVQPQVSEGISQVPEEGTQSSDDEVHSSSSTMAATGKLSPRTPPVPTTDSTKKEICQKKNPGSSLRENLRTNSANSRTASDSVNRRSVKKPEKPSKTETNKKSEVKKQTKKSDNKEALASPTQAGDNAPGNKENVDVWTSDNGLTEVV